jgi:thiol:disulfide interchange protein DsbD
VPAAGLAAATLAAGQPGGLFVLLALPMFGAFELQLPAPCATAWTAPGKVPVAATCMAQRCSARLSGLLLGPCMTAPLAGALLYIAQSGDVLQGALVLFSLGLGMGVPLLLLVTLGNRYLPRPGAWMNRVKGVFGFVFLAMALYTVRSLLPAPCCWP